MKLIGIALASFLAVWAAPSEAEMVRGQDPGTIVRALQQAGYPATLGTDKVGDPMISSSVNRTSFQIFFYNCTDHKACATLQFHSGYDLADPVGLDLINERNRAQRFSRAFLDKQNDPILEMDVDLDDGGMSPELFIDNVEFWAATLVDFEKRIGFRK